ncbi:MAG TPA: HAD family hydrolase [Victivallales bacterium]|nr:HAD family hydrolase [Victivallales bacterium]
MKFDLIIFDCDGVLVDSEPISNRVFADLVNTLGAGISYEESKTLFTGRSDSDCKKILEDRIGKKAPDNLFDEFDKLSFAAYEKDLNPVINIHKVVDLLEKKSICVASNAPKKKIHKVLSLVGLDDKFGEQIFCSDDVKRPKPYPDLFLHAAVSMNCDPVNCAVIEDSIYGARAGIAAGMTVFGYSERTDSDKLKAEGCITFNKMDQLIELLDL